ncbi:hypothetical protein BCD49_38425 [Pseudofrankia sp. EUN1h]|nr:hypothetical protein BCD49_38425 [Pseudofrankia sp. EUN1h]
MTNISRGGGGRPRHHRMLNSPLLLCAALMLGLAGCGAATSSAPKDSASTDVNHRGSTWEKIVPAGDCHCADGSQFAFWERRADPTKVVLFLNGGGVCWDAIMCALADANGENGENDNYDYNLNSLQRDGPDTGIGMFDFNRTDSPFATYSFVYVSSCTGDALLGNVSRKYSPKLTIEHRGYVDGTAALSYITEHYPNATQVVVIGKTAGSVAAPTYGGLVADRLPKARVIVFGAQSGAWPDNPDFNTNILDARWAAYHTMPTWAVNGLTASDWGPRQLWIQAGRHNPNLVLARFDFAYDPHAAREVTSWMASNPPDLLAEIDRNEAAIEAAGVPLHSYTAPGDDHGIFEFDKFYEISVNGIRLVDWLKELVTSEPPDDVHCDKCAP